MEEKEIKELLLDTQKEYTRSNKFKDKIIILLIVLMFLEAVVGYCGFVYYESQFDYVETYDTTKDVDIDTKGDNANAEYNDVNGNQHNDDAVHMKAHSCFHIMEQPAIMAVDARIRLGACILRFKRFSAYA